MLFIKLLFGALLASTAVVAHAASVEPKPNPDTPVVKKKLHVPPKKVKRIRRFTPTGTPTYSQVIAIAAHEQRRWGGPTLLNRIRCESTYNWSATNGQYRGLLQFGPIWDSMWPGTPRGVKLVSKKTKKKPVVLFTKRGDRKWKRKVTKHRVNQRIWIIKKGKLPRYPDPYHGWAAIRVGQRAVSGHGPTTAWSCGL